MLAELSRLPIVEEARIEAAAGNRAALAPPGDQRPGAVELPHRLVAVVEQALVERGHHLQRVAQADDELGSGPQPQDRLELLGSVEIADRPFGEQRSGLAIREVEFEILGSNGLAQRVGRLAAKVVTKEEMRLLGRREADIGMAAKIFRQRGRPAPRRADDEGPARSFVQTRS